MAIDFPDAPTTGDTHTSGGRTWTYDGTGWVVYGPSIDATVLRIDSGNNRVGINNSSPTVTLDVTGDTAISGNLAVGSIADVEADITTAQGDISTLQGDMTTAQGDITTLEAGATATSIKVYANATARSTAVPSPAAGDLSFLTSTASVEVYDGSAWVSVGGATMITKVARFTASGTWTVPAGVTYAIAHIRGGGGGINSNTAGGNGGSSSVAFAGGTVTAAGGNGVQVSADSMSPTGFGNAAANSGQGGMAAYQYGVGARGRAVHAMDGAEIAAGDDVTPAASITVTVGAGGTGDGDGGSGYVWIEYQQEA